jgi:hypothetical protein
MLELYKHVHMIAWGCSGLSLMLLLSSGFAGGRWLTGTELAFLALPQSLLVDSFALLLCP